jgi:hypothetical protein
MTPSDIDPHAIVTHPASWGLVGSIIALRWAPGTALWRRALNVASGVALSWVCAPAAGEYLHLTPSQLAVCGLAFGMFGLNVADAITRGIQGMDTAGMLNRVADLLPGWISSRTPTDKR